MAGGKGIVTFAGKRDAMDMPNDRSTVRPGLIEQKFQYVGQQRRRGRDEQSMITGSPQRLSAPARGKPAGGCQDQEDLLVGAPSQGVSQLLRGRRSVAGDRTRDRDIRPGRPDGDRKAWTTATATCWQSSRSEHDSDDRQTKVTSPTHELPPKVLLLSKSAFQNSGSILGSNSATAPPMPILRPNRNKLQRQPFELMYLRFRGLPMYHHVKKLMFTVRVDEPDPHFGNMLLEQFGGANGELAAAMQYSIQGLNCEDPDRKDLLMDIGTEELSHLEVVGTLARMHLKPTKFDRQAAEADPLIAIAGGGGVNLFNSQGNPWTADYLKITGELDVDLRSNIAAEARAKSWTVFWDVNFFRNSDI
jgi:hypothetical protein